MIGYSIKVEDQKAAKSQRLNTINWVWHKFEFSAIFLQWCQISPFDVENLFLELNFDSESGRASNTRYTHVISLLVDHAESKMVLTALVEQRHYLHDIWVADADRCSVGERAYMRVNWITAKDQRDHFQDVIVEHKDDKLARLAQEDWVRWLFLVV